MICVAFIMSRFAVLVFLKVKSKWCQASKESDVSKRIKSRNHSNRPRQTFTASEP